MASRKGYLVNQVTPSLVKSNEIDCRQGAIRITNTGMGATGNAWQVLVGDSANGTWVNVVRYGVPVIFNTNNTQYVEMFAGQYRVDPTSLLSSAIVAFEEDDATDHDEKVLYTFSQQNNNQNGITAESTATNTSIGNGTSANPLGFNVKFSTDADNIAGTGADGAVTAVIHDFAGPGTATITGDGTVGNPLAVAVDISTDAGNGLSVGTDGALYASAGGSTNLDPTDALALGTAFIAAITTNNNITWLGNHTDTSVVTTNNTIYLRTTLNSITLTDVFSDLHAPDTMPLQGSIGATNVSNISVGAQNDSSGVVMPSSVRHNSGAIWVLALSADATPPETGVDLFVNAIFTLQ